MGGYQQPIDKTLVLKYLKFNPFLQEAFSGEYYQSVLVL